MPDPAVPAPPADGEPVEVVVSIPAGVMSGTVQKHMDDGLSRAEAWRAQVAAGLGGWVDVTVRAGVSPQPEITHEQIRQILIKGIGRGWLRSPGGAIERTADELLALLADGATPAGPEAET